MFVMMSMTIMILINVMIVVVALFSMMALIVVIEMSHIAKNFVYRCNWHDRNECYNSNDCNYCTDYK